MEAQLKSPLWEKHLPRALHTPHLLEKGMDCHGLGHSPSSGKKEGDGHGPRHLPSSGKKEGVVMVLDTFLFLKNGWVLSLRSSPSPSWKGKGWSCS